VKDEEVWRDLMTHLSQQRARDARIAKKLGNMLIPEMKFEKFHAQFPSYMPLAYFTYSYSDVVYWFLPMRFKLNANERYMKLCKYRKDGLVSLWGNPIFNGLDFWLPQLSEFVFSRSRPYNGALTVDDNDAIMLAIWKNNNWRIVFGSIALIPQINKYITFTTQHQLAPILRNKIVLFPFPVVRTMILIYILSRIPFFRYKTAVESITRPENDHTLIYSKLKQFFIRDVVKFPEELKLVHTEGQDIYETFYMKPNAIDRQLHKDEELLKLNLLKKEELKKIVMIRHKNID